MYIKVTEDKVNTLLWAIGRQIEILAKPINDMDNGDTPFDPIVYKDTYSKYLILRDIENDIKESIMRESGKKK